MPVLIDEIVNNFMFLPVIVINIKEGILGEAEMNRRVMGWEGEGIGSGDIEWMRVAVKGGVGLERA